MLTLRSAAPRAAALALLSWGSAGGAAETARALDPVVVTATRIERSSFDLPVSIDAIDARQIQSQRAQVNISEVLNRVPGISAGARETYAQEQQLSIRGFGARSQFGVRGIKLLADGIPASTPDGQGGTGLFDLASAQRIEVLRGPFSALYGNHSGGVVQVFTEDGPERPTFTPSISVGSHDSWKAGLKFGGQSGALNYLGSWSRYDTAGYRNWSRARKDQANAKLFIALSGGMRLTLLANHLYQPDNQDPLGLSATELATLGPRAANPAAFQFRTRRSLDNTQGGLVVDLRLSDIDSLRATAYLGSRRNEQFLAIGASAQNNIRAAGAVSAFERSFSGLGARWTRNLKGLTLTAGTDYERATEARKGYRSGNTTAGDAGANFGVVGALKRDEDNTVSQAGVYVQAEWNMSETVIASGGLRHTRVGFDSRDKFICTLGRNTAPGDAGATSCSGSLQTITAAIQNPDDSGSLRLAAWTPAAGLLWKVNAATNFYANAGRSFETPTLIELAYQPDPSASGLNFALKPSTSSQYEVGLKSHVGPFRLNVAAFYTDTRREIVVLNNLGGRATYQNATKTTRSGLEFALDGQVGRDVTAYFAATLLDARFKDGFNTCVAAPCPTPNSFVTVGAGKRIPGIARHSLYGELTWRHAPTGFSAAIEARGSGKVMVDDRNSASAPAYGIANIRVGFEQILGRWRLTEFARVDNVLDKDYIGAVYVNDGNNRFFAPATTRSYLIGASASHSF